VDFSFFYIKCNLLSFFRNYNIFRPSIESNFQQHLGIYSFRIQINCLNNSFYFFPNKTGNCASRRVQKAGKKANFALDNKVNKELKTMERRGEGGLLGLLTSATSCKLQDQVHGRLAKNKH